MGAGLIIMWMEGPSDHVNRGAKHSRKQDMLEGSHLAVLLLNEALQLAQRVLHLTPQP